MEELLSRQELSPVMKVWLGGAVFLFLKMYTTSVIQGVVKLRSRHFDWPEDAAFFGKGESTATYPSVLERAKGVWRNDLENIPAFLLLSLGAAMAGAPFYRFTGFVALFILTRTAHSFFLLRPRQPHRNLAYQLSTLATLMMIVDIILALIV